MIEDVVKKGHICFPMIPGFDYVEDAMEMSDVHPTHSEPPNISWIPMSHFNRKLPILPRSCREFPFTWRRTHIDPLHSCFQLRRCSFSFVGGVQKTAVLARNWRATIPAQMALTKQ